MLILGVETSCDETSVAIVEDGWRVHANVIFSQIDIHRATGGVVPEVAAREHVKKILPVLEEALAKATASYGKPVTLETIDAIAVTYGPGLLTSLLTGINTAATLALVAQKSLIPVHHIEGHMYANWLDVEPASAPQFPLVVLTASGGHNELIVWHDHGKYTFLGATLDDAAGEAFDKVARLIGLPYPGGPQIQKAAEKGDPTKYHLPRGVPHGWDFSFSGLKTAAMRLVKEHKAETGSAVLSEQFVCDAAAAFQESVCDSLATKLARAAEEFGVKEAHLAGGVSANARLRARARELLPRHVALKFCSKLSYCTDNAAMIAAAGYFRYQAAPQKYQTWRPITGNPNLPLENWLPTL